MSVEPVGKVWCSSDCTGRGIMMKRMMIHIRSVRVRGSESEGNSLLSPGDCFWLTEHWSYSGVRLGRDV